VVAWCPVRHRRGRVMVQPVALGVLLSLRCLRHTLIYLARGRSHHGDAGSCRGPGRVPAS
jgi:hypothetical protein